MNKLGLTDKKSTIPAASNSLLSFLILGSQKLFFSVFGCVESGLIVLSTSFHHIDILRIPLPYLEHLMIIPNINDSLLKLSRRNLPLEQNVQLPITPPLQFR